jgi:2-polyprenyl-3-methyl-5-hydroxy-6-metoxy-1,4-benzoquinol methylase
MENSVSTNSMTDIPQQSEHQNCLLCSSADLTSISGFDSQHLVRCGNCGFVFVKLIPTLQRLEEFYSRYSYGREQYLSPLTIESYNRLLDYFEKYRKLNTILDTGCGMGWFLDEAIKRGWKAYGTEYSKLAVEQCSARGINMKEGMLNPNDFDTEFDVIVSSEVIEHINYPKTELQNIYTLLRKNGLVYLTTPNFNCYLRYYLKDKYSIFNYPEHLCFFTPKTMNYGMKHAGFKKKKLLTTGVSLVRAAKPKKNTIFIAKDNKDEKLRQAMSKNKSMRVLKEVVNTTLTVTGLGLTVKAYYEK